MSNIFITSDEHYGHVNWKNGGGILHLAKRPFSDIIEMREALIQRHNEVVPPSQGYLTIHVGDMFWMSMESWEATRILDRLNGRHAFMFGNHDELIEKSSDLQSKFDWVYGENKAGGAKLLRWNKHKLTLNHFAQRVWEGSHKGHWHVYGHSHNALPGLGKSFDIGVDGNNFYPWSIEQIEKKMSTLEQHHTIDNTGRPGGEDIVKESLSQGLVDGYKESRFDRSYPKFDHLPEGSH